MNRISAYVPTIALSTLLMLFLLPETSSAQYETTRVLTLTEAEEILDAAQARAEEDEWTVAIAIVDAGGHLLAFRRIDGTQVGSAQYAIDKAVSSVYFQRPTKAFQDGVSGGNNALLTLTGAVHLEGGIPIEYNGRVIGGIGVSGVTAQQDGVIARAGLEALGL